MRPAAGVGGCPAAPPPLLNHHTLLAVEASYPITWAVTSVAILLYYRFGRWLHPPKKA